MVAFKRKYIPLTNAEMKFHLKKSLRDFFYSLVYISRPRSLRRSERRLTHPVAVCISEVRGMGSPGIGADCRDSKPDTPY